MLMKYWEKYSNYLLAWSLTLINWALFILVVNRRKHGSGETNADFYKQ